MFESTLFILLCALILDWTVGDPDVIWNKVPHPVVLFGKAISFADRKLNLEKFDAPQRMRNGALAICLLIILSIVVAFFLEWLLSFLGWFSIVVEIVIVAILLAQKSLFLHVKQVAVELGSSGLKGGQAAVGKIVGRDPKLLDEEGVCRASIETLAENYSDGVLAPAFWYGVFGLPGIFAYKMINSADSMIGYKSNRYLHFGKAAAQIDDLANWLPARLSALVIALGALCSHGFNSAKNAVNICLQDAGLHRSPNAGWPESAMAGALDIALGGPRKYDHEIVQQAYLNASGKRALGVPDIYKALSIFSYACFALMAVVAMLMLF